MHSSILGNLLAAVGFSCLVTGAAAAQQSLSGRVMATDSTPLADALVRVLEARRSTTTDHEGRYEIGGLPSGVYTVSFTLIGYAPQVRKVTLRESDVTVDVTLRATVVELAAVQVTGSAVATSALSSPQPIAMVAGDELRRVQAPSLGETVSQLTSVRSVSTGPAVGKPVIRGLTSNRVLVLDDGQRLETQQWGDEHAPDISTAGAQRIEVVRGPQSVLYGSDALGGVINVIAPELPEAIGRAPYVGGSVSGGFATNGRQPEATAGIHGASGGFGFRASFHGRNSQNVRTATSELWNSASRAAGGSGSVGYRGSWGSISGDVDYLDQRVEFPEGDPDETPLQRIGEQRGRVVASLSVGGSRLEVTGSYERNRRREFEEAQATEVAVGLLSKTYLGSAHLYHSLAPNIGGAVGVSAYRTRFDKFGTETLIPNSTTDNLGVFAFEQVEAGRWNFTVGGRYDYRRLDVESDADIAVAADTRTYHSVTGSLGALWHAADAVALVANVGRGFRAPSSFELFAHGVHEGTLAFERGNPNLDTEKSLNTDLAIRVQSSSVSAEIGGFVNLIQDYIFTVPSGTTDSASGLQIYDVTQGDARLTGVEAAVEVHPTPYLHVSGTADYVHGQNVTTGQPLPSMPPFRVTYTLRFEGFPEGALAHPYLSIGGETYARQTRLDPAEAQFFAQAFDGAGYRPAGYTLVHLSGGLTLRAGGREMHVDVTLRNALDQAYADFLSRVKTAVRNPGQGRNLIVRLTTEF